ncbi:MAG: alpha/beta hydrolase [Schleiferiaceae bacterium]
MIKQTIVLVSLACAVMFSVQSCQTTVASDSSAPNPIVWDTITGASTGTLLRLDSFESNYIRTRPVDVWLPSGYKPKRKHAVLYMYDGQMLFDSSSTWNKQEWGVDETLDRLIASKQVLPTIVVALHNGGVQRNFEYFPQAPFEALQKTFSDSLMSDVASHYGSDSTFPVQSDAYLKYIVEEVKPLIDSTFSTYTSKEGTVIAGSSMGGLMSMYVLGEYPEVFSKALCLSTHWPGGYSPNDEVPAVFHSYIQSHLDASKQVSIYFDYGTETLDQMYEPFQLQVNEVLEQNGFTQGEDWVTKKFEGAEHSEKSWADRLDVPLLFALEKQR